MPLTGNEIINGGFIQNHVTEHIRDASYDLSMDFIIRNGKDESGDSANIQPQEMFIFISKETVKVPNGYVGYAMPKTSLCNRGILALNTGIIDPGYEGRMSATAINFSDKPIDLDRGE